MCRLHENEIHIRAKFISNFISDKNASIEASPVVLSLFSISSADTKEKLNEIEGNQYDSRRVEGGRGKHTKHKLQQIVIFQIETAKRVAATVCTKALLDYCTAKTR